MTVSVALDGVTKRFREVTAVKNVTLSASTGEVLGILGPSGAGKSTLIRLMDLLERPDEGAVHIRGEAVDASSIGAGEVRRSIGMVLQKPVVLNRSVANNLAYVLEIRGWDEEKIRAKVASELELFGLSNRKGVNARTLSGGEMQRLCFARATISSPRILLLDEFAANLDPANVSLLEQRIRDYAEADRDRTVVMVTHNLFQARRMCDKIALLWNGEVVELAENEKFFGYPDDPRTAAFVKGDIVY